MNGMIKYWLLLSVILVCGCASSHTTREPGYLSVQNGHFVDQNGRTVILNGLNHVNKSPRDKYLHEGDEQLFKRLKEWGINSVRYGIHWDGLEPEPGKINEDYLKEIDKRVKWAADNDIWLVLDMHQDLYGRKFDNGAPDWATLDEGLPHTTGEVWSAAYMLSAAVQKAFDNFWKNAPASDGIGIQDHYINLWKMLAARYADSSSVAGFDVMNEPFAGTSATAVFPKLVEGCTEAIGLVMAKETGKLPTEEEVQATWGDGKQRFKILMMVNDKKIFAKMVDKATGAVNVFDAGLLSDFYQRIRDSIRTVSPRQILFLEHSFFSNLGIPSHLKVPVDVAGTPDPYCAYAPHGYDLVTDTEYSSQQGNERVELIFSRLFETGKKNNIPVWIGEWGAFYLGSGKYLAPARHIIGMIEQNQAGQSYWSYWDDIDTQDYFLGAIVRPYPMFTNGELKEYRNDFDKKEFKCLWTEQSGNKTPTRIYIPDLKALNKDDLRLSPLSEITFTTFEGSPAGYMEIAPVSGERNLTLTFY